MNPKDLKKLAKACRDAGIKHYKDANIEFTLTEETPVSKYLQAKTLSPNADLKAPQDPFEEESLTQDQLLNWSVVEVDAPTGETQ